MEVFMKGSNGFLTTHILDTANGVPAQGVRIELYRLDGDRRCQLSNLRTNQDGRTDHPIIPKGSMEAGRYELLFFIGDYFAGEKEKLANDFLDVVPVRFGISNSDEHYHVPLLASPYSFSTYRGS
mgnify:FL=1